MDKNSFIQLVKAQLTGLHATALSELGDSHALTFTLGQALAAAQAANPADDVKPADPRPFGAATPLVEVADEFRRNIGADVDDAEYEEDYREVVVRPNLPEAVATEGVTDAEVAEATEILRNSVPDTTVLVPEDEDDITDYVPTAPVFAEIPTANGGTVTIGDESQFEALREEFADEEEQGEPQIVITYARKDGAEFTRDQLDKVLAHPISVSGLQRLGARVPWEIEQSEDKASFRTTWFVAEGDVPLAAVRARAVGYQGEFPFPGIGLVSAKASAYADDVAE